MSSNKKQVAAKASPAFLKNFKFSWLLYGAAAYYGLKFMSKRGIFSTQADAALDVIDQGIDMAKQTVGLGAKSEQPSATHH
jgi:hypothetical protein